MTDEPRTDELHTHPPDLEWTAFCYVAGELTETEVAGFEELLARDQAAREAVARACELAQAVSQASVPMPSVPMPSVTVARRPVESRRAFHGGWISVASGLALIGLVVLLSLRGTEPETTDRSATERLASEELAQLWLTTREKYAASLPVQDVEEGLTELAWDEPSLAELPLVEEAVSDQGLVAPSWMIAAVASLDGQRDVEN